MDGNFKARHLKSAGTEGRDALEGVDSDLFIPYSKVKERVERLGESDVKVDCTSVFVVDNENAKRSAQYDVQGIFAWFCRHYFFIKGVLMWHGERLGYPLAVLEEIVGAAADHGVVLSERFTTCFDVACRQRCYNATRATEGVKQVQLATGKLHGRTHSLECQLGHNCLYAVGAGNTPGEQAETAWHTICKGFLPTKYCALPKFLAYYDTRARHWNEQRREVAPKHVVDCAKRAVEAEAKARADLPLAHEALYGSDATNEALFGSDATDATTELRANYVDAMEKLRGIVSPATADEATADITTKDKAYALKLHNYLTELKKVCA